jgi:hypothetical protein
VEGFIQVSNLFLQIMLKHRDQYCVTILMIPVFFDDGIYIHTYTFTLVCIMENLCSHILTHLYTKLYKT